MGTLGASGNRCAGPGPKSILFSGGCEGQKTVGVALEMPIVCSFPQHLLSTASFDHKDGTSQKLGGLVS